MTHTLAHYAPTLSFLVLLTLKTTVLLAVTWITAGALRGQSAALRHRVWALGIAGALALPLLTASLPEITVRPLGNAIASATAVPTFETASPQAMPADVPPPRVAWYREYDRLVLVLWAFGSLFVTLNLIAGLARLTRLAARARPLSDEGWLRTLAELSESFGVRRSVRLLECSNPAAMPITWGVLRPRIILPDGAAEWPEERRRIVLSHELAHIGRHDWLLQICAEFLRSAYWFHPLAWVASNRLRHESERACDDLVLNSGVEPSRYADELVALARILNSPIRNFSIALAISRPSNLERRFASMLDTSMNRRPLSRKSSILAVACALCLLAPMAALHLSAQGLSGEFTGTIRDPTGGVVPNSTATIVSKQADTMDATASDSAGNFKFAGLPAGGYELRVEKAGFDPYTAPIALEAGRPLAVNVHLQVETHIQRVTITSDSPAKAPRAASQIPVGGKVDQARILSRKNPIYPEALRTTGVEGDVIMRAIIGKDGNLLSVRVVNTQIDPQLAKAALEAVNQWRYSPEQLNGVPVETETVISVGFRLVNPSDTAR